ncbi:hypothetical protein AALO_G00015540 [Alosa alosa]|uniref:BTB domain-containing protein n=2 Tax=Alosa alosa TaxID=278164 RepID=A0AAV6HGX6_9TELE|nr:mitochondrial import inner membrane translocase subunit Tim10 isoform X1 [Alosa alosa]KAG5286503.1 hypothetical protein AALO_G00015540 [Alosa alosa]
MWRYRQPGVAFQLLGELQRQQHCNILCDALLQTEGMSVPVHSCILAAFSPFLYRELSTSPSYPVGQRRLIRVPAIGAQALLKLISYLYSGEMRGLGPREHEEVKAAFIRLGMSHLIHTFEEDSRQWRGIDRGLQLEMEESVQVGAEQRSATRQTPEGKGVDKSTQTEAESTVHAATQTSRREAHAFSDQWLSPSSDGHGSAASSAIQFAEVSPTARASTFVILTPVSDPPLSSDNIGSCQVSLIPSPSVHCDHLPPYSLIANPSNTFNPSFERLSDDFSSATAQPNDSMVSTSQVGKERADTRVEAGTVVEPGPEEQVSKDGTDEASTSKVRRSERLMTMKEKPGQDVACTSEEPVKVLKIKFKRKCKNDLWEIESMKEDPAMKVKLSMSPATTQAQKDLTASEERQNGSSVLTPPHDPRLSSPSKMVITSVHILTPAASRRSSPSVHNKAALSPTHSQPEECDEQMDKLLDDIMMDLNFLLPITTERGDSRPQQRPLPYLPGDTSGLDPTPWLGEVSMEVSMVNGDLDRSAGQTDKAVGSDLTLVSQFDTSLAESVESVQSSHHPGSKSTPCHVEPRNSSSCSFTHVKSARACANTASLGFPESDGNAGFSNAELSLAHHGWSSWRKLPSPNPISKEPKGRASYSCTPDLDEMRLRSCLSPLQSEDESTVKSQRLNNQPPGQSATSGQRLSQEPVNIPPWLSLKPVDLRFPLNSILLKSPSQTDEGQHPAVKRTRRQTTLLAQNNVFSTPDSETCSGSSISGQKASRIDDGSCVRSIVTRKQSLERQRSIEEPKNSTVKEQSLRKGLRRLVAKRICPVEENDHKTSAGVSPGLGLQNTDSNARHSSTLAERSKGRSVPAFANRKEDLSEVARSKQGGGHAKSVTDSKSLSSPEIPKRKRGRPPKNQVHPGVLSSTVRSLTAVRKARSVNSPRRPALETPTSRQRYRTSSKNRQAQEDNIDSLAEGKSQDETPNQKSEHQSPTLSPGAVMKNQSAEANNVQRDTLASSSELKPTSVAEMKSNGSTPTPSQTLKRFRELLERKGYLVKRKREAEAVGKKEGDVQNRQCLEEKETSASAETDETTASKAPMQCHLNRHFIYPANKGDTNSQQAPPQRISAKPGAKASRARKWTEGSTGSCDEEEEDQEDQDLEEDVDVMSGSPVTLPVFESGLVGREPSDVEEIDEDVDIITVDID